MVMEQPKKMHNVYHIQDVTDLQKIKEVAQKNLVGDRFTDPIETVVHHHKFNMTCVGSFHEEIQFPKPDEKEVTNA